MTTLKVLYITGWCRSGSTILGNVLNEIDGFLHVGELYYYWINSRGKGTNELCGCGAKLTACPFWQAVESQVRGNMSADDMAAKVIACHDQIRTRHTRRILAGYDHPQLDSYADILGRTYRAIQETSGAHVIVDSGKYPAEAALLARVQGVAAHYLHMVRDPRATAYSWSKKKSYIPSMPNGRSSAYWLGFNLVSDRIRARHANRSTFMRYEDFIARPETEIARLLKAIGESPPHNPVRNRTVWLGDNHTVTGNPDRLRRGKITIASHDNEWKKSYGTFSHLLVNMIAWPRLRSYGYRLFA